MKRAVIVDVSSPGEGLIHQINVTIAVLVKQGEVMMNLAAASHLHDIEAPCSGTVVEILVKEGDAVKSDQIIARVKEGGTQ